MLPAAIRPLHTVDAPAVAAHPDEFASFDSIHSLQAVTPQHGGSPHATVAAAAGLNGVMTASQLSEELHGHGAGPTVAAVPVDRSPQIPSLDHSGMDVSPGRGPRVAKRPVNPPTGKSLFITNLSPSAEFTDLHEAFGRFGKLVSCRVLKDAATGLSRRIGYVNFEEPEDAAEALGQMNGTPGPHGAVLTIKYADNDPNFTPEATKKLFVRRVPADATAEAVKRVFEEYATVVECSVQRDISTQGLSEKTEHQMAYVTFESTDQANAIVSKTHGRRLFGPDSTPLVVKPAETLNCRNQRVRRLNEARVRQSQSLSFLGNSADSAQQMVVLSTSQQLQQAQAQGAVPTAILSQPGTVTVIPGALPPSPGQPSALLSSQPPSLNVSGIGQITPTLAQPAGPAPQQGAPPLAPQQVIYLQGPQQGAPQVSGVPQMWLGGGQSVPIGPGVGGVGMPQAAAQPGLQGIPPQSMQTGLQQGMAPFTQLGQSLGQQPGLAQGLAQPQQGLQPGGLQQGLQQGFQQGLQPGLGQQMLVMSQPGMMQGLPVVSQQQQQQQQPPQLQQLQQQPLMSGLQGLQGIQGQGLQGQGLQGQGLQGQGIQGQGPLQPQAQAFSPQ